MVFKIYNTLKKKKEVFKPIDLSCVRMYTCGPTVYNYAHLGNFRAYIAADILKRYLKFLGYKVKHVMNITDVDDKTIRDSQKAGVSLKEFTDKYANAFFEDLKMLNIDPPDIFPRATEHIKEMVELIKKLMEKGYAYKGEDGSVYFNISKFKDYGKLSGIKINQLKPGARVRQDSYTKEEARDFALWKAWDECDGDVFWDTEIGKGRPGWHIECSAMSMKYLGESFDIHTGGVDLIFPHHENEICQSEAATGEKPFVKYWFHNEWLLVNGQKMSKSLGNFFTLRDILAKGYSPKAVRYLLLSGHYRSQLNFTEEELKSAERTVDKMIEFMEKLERLKFTGEYNEKLHFEMRKAQDEFVKYMDDDLNMPQALAVIFNFMNVVNKAISENALSQKNAQEIYETMKGFDKVLGLLSVEKEEVPKEIQKLVDEREKARKAKDFKKADKIREQIRKAGWEIQDTESGPILRKKRGEGVAPP